VSQDIRLYQSADIWDQPMQEGQFQLVRALLDLWPEQAATALDVGCGDGKLTALLARETQTAIVGLDSSLEALSRLQTPGVRGDAQKMPFEDGRFDLVYSTDTLEHLPDAEEGAAWGELFRVASKWVMVAVPFREELLDATARCKSCGQPYHVNWHQRSYDIPDLHRRAPKGWSVGCTVLSGESWSPMLPLETHWRRHHLQQWAGWEMAVCPHCSSHGSKAQATDALPPVVAAALGEQVYSAIKARRYWRSHSEILVLFHRDGETFRIAPKGLRANPVAQPAASIDVVCASKEANLLPYPQVGQCVTTGDSRLIMQLPLYDAESSLIVERSPGSDYPVHLHIEDALGCVFSGEALAIEQASNNLSFERPLVAGYYGIIVTCDENAAPGRLTLGDSPTILRAAPTGTGTTQYHPLNSANGCIWVQINKDIWIDESALAPPLLLEPDALQILNATQQTAQTWHLQAQLQSAVELQSIRSTHELLAVQVQNLEAERDALLLRAQEADRLAVQVQNLTAEVASLSEQRTTVLPGSPEDTGLRDQIDCLSIQAQNLSTENDLLREALQLAERDSVALQNVSAERDALLLRAMEADRSAVLVQNLQAELTILQRRLQEHDRVLVNGQNLEAECAVLRERAAEADALTTQLENLEVELRQGQLLHRQQAEELTQSLIELQNLQAEREVFALRAQQGEQYEVQVQNLLAEREALTLRAQQGDRFEVQVQNLLAEREALTLRAQQSDELEIQVQNLLAEYEVLALRSLQSDKLEVQVQNLLAEREVLTLRAHQGDQFEVQVQNLLAEREALTLRAQQSDELEIQVQNLLAEYEALALRSLQSDKLEVQVQNLLAEREALTLRAQQGDQFEVQVQNLLAERESLVLRARQGEQLEVQRQNLLAEREALQRRAQDADTLEVQLQNLGAENQALLAAQCRMESQAVALQNAEAHRDALLERAAEADRLAVTVQNLEALNNSLQASVQAAERLAVVQQNLEAERDVLRTRAEDGERQRMKLQTLQDSYDHAIEQRNALLEKLQEASLRIDELTQASADRDDLNLQLNALQIQADERLQELERLNQHIENQIGARMRDGLCRLRKHLSPERS
jgi:SAM-dependent methyltransferase